MLYPQHMKLDTQLMILSADEPKSSTIGSQLHPEKRLYKFSAQKLQKFK